MTHTQREHAWTPHEFVRLASLLAFMTIASTARPSAAATQETHAPQARAAWPQRVLLTNDDGIDSPALRALARAFAAAGIRTYVAAPRNNQSGTGSFMPSLQTDEFLVEPASMGPGIVAWAVSGYPADCVLFALRGPMADDPPDLVVSGPNIGANLGEAWFISGTIGAARAAAFMGVPAVAISGANVRDSLSVNNIARWVVQFVRSEPVHRLRSPEYLNVNVPLNLRGVQGVTVTERSRLLNLRVRRDTSSAAGPGPQRWRLGGSMGLADAPGGTDAFAFMHDSISIEPLTVGERDSVMAEWLAEHLDLVPPWPVADTAGQGGRLPRPRRP